MTSQSSGVSLGRDEQCHILLHGLTSVLSSISGLRRTIHQSRPTIPRTTRDELNRQLTELDGLVQDQVFAAETVLASIYPNYYRTLDYAGNRPALLNPGKLATEIADGYRLRAQRRGIEIHIDIEERAEQVELLVLESMLRRAIHHAMSNAVKYSYHGTLDTERDIRITFRKHDRFALHWVLSIQNYGVGIEEDELQLVTQPGYRGRQAVREGRTGAGLGLSDINAIMKLHGGRLQLTSAPVLSDAGPPAATHPYLTTVNLILPTRTTFLTASGGQSNLRAPRPKTR